MEVLNKEKVEIVLSRDKNDNRGIDISLRDIIEIFMKAKWIIAISVFIGILLAFAAGMYMQYRQPYRGSVNMIVSFNFNGIEKGLDPYGNDFDISKAKSPAVLSKVVDALNLSNYGISEDNIRTNLKIVPIIPGNITEKIKALQESKAQNVGDGQDYTYYPNTYLFTLNIPRSFSISNFEAREILDELFKQYKVYFYKNYYGGTVLTDEIGPIDYSIYDYPEQIEILQNQIMTLKNYLKIKNNEMGATGFRSKKYGFTFNDIIESITILEKVDVQSIGASIDSYNLTKDKEALIKLYEYRIQESELTSKKKNDEAKIYANSISQYQKDKNILVIPSNGVTSDINSVEKNQTSKYYDDLIEKSILAETQAKEAVNNANYYRKQINKLKNDTVDKSKKKEAEKKVNLLLDDVRTKFREYIDISNETVQEFYNSELFKRAMTILSPAEYSSTKSSLNLYLAIGALGGLMIGLFYVFLKEYLKRTEKTNNDLVLE
jgi:capsular polysaccharide biosynthesis protein